jgi:hypothetical protein
VRDGVDGAPPRVGLQAPDLKRRLELILEGEKPYDIFVRWKPLAEQPIGWNPDLNDGVRMNIRPFMIGRSPASQHKRPKLNISWNKDLGIDEEIVPWFHIFESDRINDHHLSLAEKTGKKSKSDGPVMTNKTLLESVAVAIQEAVKVNGSTQVKPASCFVAGRRRPLDTAFHAFA